MRKYRLVAKKGEGTFSEVLKAQNIKNSKYHAIKCMKNRFDNIDQVNNLREIQALRRLSPHDHVVKLEEVLYDQPTGRLALVFELMDANLYELIKGRKHYLKPQLIKSFMYQLMKSLDHMHRKGIFHRDIKPENILVESSSNMIKGLKLADFGSCRGIYSKQPYTEYISTRWYRAPECLLTDGYYGPEMDIWGAGCVMFEITSLYPLFPGNNESDQITKIHKILGTPSKELIQKFKQKGASHINFDFPSYQGVDITQLIPHASSDLVDLIKKMIHYDYSQRITAREALQHPYFEDMRQLEARMNLNQQQQQPSSSSSLSSSHQVSSSSHIDSSESDEVTSVTSSYSSASSVSSLKSQMTTNTQKSNHSIQSKKGFGYSSSSSSHPSKLHPKRKSKKTTGSKSKQISKGYYQSSSTSSSSSSSAHYPMHTMHQERKVSKYASDSVYSNHNNNNSKSSKSTSKYYHHNHHQSNNHYKGNYRTTKREHQGYYSNYGLSKHRQGSYSKADPKRRKKKKKHLYDSTGNNSSSNRKQPFPSLLVEPSRSHGGYDGHEPYSNSSSLPPIQSKKKGGTKTKRSSDQRKKGLSSHYGSSLNPYASYKQKPKRQSSYPHSKLTK